MKILRKSTYLTRLIKLSAIADRTRSSPTAAIVALSLLRQWSTSPSFRLLGTISLAKRDVRPNRRSIAATAVSSNSE